MNKKIASKSETSQTSQSGDKKAKRPMIKCADFNKQLLTFSAIDLANERSQQGIAYPRYKYPKVEKESNLVYTTKEIRLSQYGLPSLKTNMKGAGKAGKGKWAGYTDDKSRGFIKVPIDPDQENCLEVEQTLSGIDEIAADEKSRAIIFGKSAKSYKYQPIIREPQEEEVVDEDADKTATVGEKKQKFKFFKVKLDRDYETDKIITKVFIKQKTDDGFELSQVAVENETELEQYLTWNSTIRMIILVNKLWADKAKKPGYDSKTYGITQKVIQLEIQPNDRTRSVREDLNDYAFDDDGTVSVVKTLSKTAQKTPSTKNNKVTQQLDAEDAEVEEEVEEEVADEEVADETVEEEVEQEEVEQEEADAEEEVADEEVEEEVVEEVVVKPAAKKPAAAKPAGKKPSSKA